jgi:acylpyruvate hydrolase
MKLVTFEIKANGKTTIGALTDAGYVDFVGQSNGHLPACMNEFLAGGKEYLANAEEVLKGATAEHTYSADDIVLKAPVPRPGKIIHTSCNFDAHLNELTEWEAPEWKDHGWDSFHFEHPTGFLEAPSSIVASGEAIAAPRFTKQLDFEIEVGIVINKKCVGVSVEEAMDYVAGLTIFNDVSARDIQAREHANKVILMGKSFLGGCPFGPYLLTTDEIEDVNNLKMELRLNGEPRQVSNMSETHYNVAQLVSWWSEMGLEPGDIITTGSPPGVISGMKNPEWLKPGDLIEAEVEKLGVLVTPIKKLGE